MTRASGLVAAAGVIACVVAGGCGTVEAPPRPGAQFTDDALDGEFGAGTFENTAWTGDRVELELGATEGAFVSRVIDAGVPDTAWLSVSWRPQAPYAKPLPGDQDAEREYPNGAVDMLDNVLLLRMDSDEPLVDGAVVPDASGRGNDAIVHAGVAVLNTTRGRFDGAIDDTASSSLGVPLAATSDFEFGTADFSWAVWVRTTEDCTGNKVHIGVEDPGPDRSHLWLGCGDSRDFASCPAGAEGGRAAGALLSNQPAGDGVIYCGTSAINDGDWHHLALVKQGHDPSTVRLYVDGQVEFSQQAQFIDPIGFPGDPELTIGDFSDGSGRYQATAAIDELAIWRRALSADEVAAIHRRGALRLGFQVRTCADPACEQSSAFAGPDADPARLFTDPPESLGGAPAALFDTDVTGRFIQYRAVFESDSAADSPELRAVTVTAQE